MQVPTQKQEAPASTSEGRVGPSAVGRGSSLSVFSFTKPAQFGTETPWHHDQALWPNWKPTAVTCWVALDECTRENGCLQFVPGSHENGYVEHVDDDSKPHHRIPDEEIDETEAEYATMERGDAVFFNPLVFHGSDPNHTDSSRLSITSTYCSRSEFDDAYQNARWVDNRRDMGSTVDMDEDVYRSAELYVNPPDP